MTRTERAALATTAVIEALLPGDWVTEATLLKVATAQLGPRGAFLAQRIVNSVLEVKGKIGPGFAIRTETYDANGIDETFAFRLVG